MQVGRHVALLALLWAAWSGCVGAQERIGFLSAANFNTTSDQQINIGTKGGSNAPRVSIRRITVQNCTASLTLAVGGFYTGAGKSGTTLVANTQVYSALTGSGKFLDVALASIVLTDVISTNTIFFALTTAQGSAVTCDIAVFGDVLT